MTITSRPFTFYLPVHTSPCIDQCPIHAPSTCTLGIDPRARHSLFGCTDPYYTDNFYSSCGLQRPPATLALPLLCNCTVLPVLFQRGPVWVQKNTLHLHNCRHEEVLIRDIYSAKNALRVPPSEPEIAPPPRTPGNTAVSEGQLVISRPTSVT